MKTLIKICGIRRIDDLNCAMESGADLIGFVFAKNSPRYIDPSDVASIIESTSYKLKTVAVMQHPNQSDVDQVFKYLQPTFLQTDAEDFNALTIPREVTPIKVYRERVDLNISSIDDNPMALLEGSVSGSGKMVTQDLLIKACKSKKLLIAGGLSLDNLKDTLESVRPFGVDVSSGVESSRGIKNKEKIIEFNRIVSNFDESRL